jgi:hypothetical protein
MNRVFNTWRYVILWEEFVERVELGNNKFIRRVGNRTIRTKC